MPYLTVKSSLNPNLYMCERETESLVGVVAKRWNDAISVQEVATPQFSPT